MFHQLFYGTRFNRVFRYSALALAALAVAGQLFGVVHLALVQHVTCAEHGELIEAGSASVQTAAPITGPSVSRAAVEGHGHDHCAIALLRRQQARVTTARPGPLALALAPHASVTIASFSNIAIDILSLAPKNSPPV
jgi:hypothetical protein